MLAETARRFVGPVVTARRFVAETEYSDPKVAGWWVWGICTWIGNGWCSRDERLHRCLPKIASPGHGLHAPSRKKPLTHRNKAIHRSGLGEASELFEALAGRLRGVRICCGDWTRVLGRSTLGIDTAHGMTPCAILLDPPYAHDHREKRLYREDDASISPAVRTWALEHGDDPSLRIALCGQDGEHAMPSTWRCIAWRSNSSAASRAQERIWFSPHCLAVDAQRDLFAAEYSA